jgi:hypothetical protein
MRNSTPLVTLAAAGLLAAGLSLPARQAQAQVVFQAAGPDAASIAGTVAAFRAALGEPNNANNPGPLAAGRREINWDGGAGNNDPNLATTTAPATPFVVFQNIRGATFTTPGTGLSQGPASGGGDGGFATLVGNPTYGDTFTFFSPARLFGPVGSTFTDGVFSVPGTGGTVPAAVRGFGAVFTDVDKPNGDPIKHSTQIEYFGVDGRRIFTGLVPAAPGDKGLSFFGLLFDEAVITRVRIKTGDAKLGPDDGKQDIVLMDDFLYGEPQPLE